MIKEGDLVLAQGQTGVFIVRHISPEIVTAEIELFSISKQQPMGYRIKVPRSVLSLFKEDASHAAARIVRDATGER
jgi:hypothetical protein